MTLLASATSLERRADGAAVAVDRPAASRRLNHDVVRALLSKDMAAARRSRSIVLPMLVVPFVLLVGLPVGIAIYARAGTPPDLGRFLEQLPGPIARDLSALPAQQRLLELVLGYLVAPLFLIVPMMVSAVLAADTFAGEKERRTLETLLHLPIRDRDLYLAKLAGAFIPATAVSWVGFAIFCVVSNAICWPVMQRIFLPTGLWLIVIIWLAPAVAALGLGIMVRVSIRVNNSQEAQQLGGAVVLPFVVLTVGQTTGLLLAGPPVALSVGAVVWAIALVLNVRGARAYSRERMASRL